jgi:hypothetical protein
LSYLSPEEYERKFIEERDKKLGEVLDNKKELEETIGSVPIGVSIST